VPADLAIGVDRQARGADALVREQAPTLTAALLLVRTRRSGDAALLLPREAAAFDAGAMASQHA